MKTKKMAYCAIFAALTAILSQIAIPLGPVPLNLALISVFMSGAMLGPLWGGLSMLIYILLGIVGVPVFSGFRGGVSIIAGATGGFIIAYFFVSVLVGLFCMKKNNIWLMIISMFLSLILTYSLGALWFMQFTASSFKKALTLCVIPFIFGDIIKIILSTLLSYKLRKILKL